MSSEAISVVDISGIGLASKNPSEDDYLEVGKALDAAFENIGFVYLKGHGIDSDTVVKDAMAASRKFFKQPEEEKAKICKEDRLADLTGWVAQNREVFDQAESGEKATLELRESFDFLDIRPEARFPDSTVPEFREKLVPLAKQSIALTHRILKAVSVILHQDKDFLSNLHRFLLDGENATTMRTLYYPPILGPVEPGHIRCGEHSDYGTITLLYQDEFPGLEVKSVSGKWVEASPIPGTILVNIGDLLEKWTAGRYPATMHRVIIPSEEIQRKATRQSIVFFVHPDDEVLVEPITGPHEKFPPINALKHLQNRFAQTYVY